MSSERARERIWPTVPIYVIEPRESLTMKKLFPTGLDVYNGAVRIWFPGIDEDSERGWHPLIYEMGGVYGEGALDRLAAEFAHKNPELIADLSPQERAVLGLRALTRPAASACGRPEPALLVPLATRKDLRRLTSDLRRAERDYPIVVLTIGDRVDAPIFPQEAVRPAIDPHIPIYVLGTSDLCRRLEQTLAPELAVHRGDARVFWPGVDRDSDPAEHPLVSAHSGGDRRDAPERLIAALELSRAGVRGHVVGTQERLRAAEQRAADALREVRESRAERDTAVARAEKNEATRATAEQQLGVLRLAGLDQTELKRIAAMDTDARPHRLTSREWISALQTPGDREKYPLTYVFGSGFIKSVDDLRGTLLERTAWVCAMVASGRAKGTPGVEPHQLRSGHSGSNEQLTRPDGAKALICKLNGEGASRLQYWVAGSRMVEFAAVTVHDAIGQRA